MRQTLATTQTEHITPGCITIGALVVMIGLALGVPLLVQTSILAAVWAGDISKVPYTAQQALSFSFIQPIILSMIAFGLLIRTPRYRAVVYVLLTATGCAAVLLIPRLIFDPTAVYTPAVARIIICLLFAVPLLFFALQRGTTLNGSGMGLALFLAALSAIPWVRVGAFGNSLDLLLAILQGITIGLFGAGLLGAFLLPAIRDHSSGPGWDLFLVGVTLTAALVGIGGAFGQDDYQALLMPVLGGIGFAAAAVALPNQQQRSGLLAPAILIGCAASMPLAFADAEEIGLIVALSDDTFKFTQAAASQVLLGGILLFPFLQIAVRRLPNLAPMPVIAGLALAAWLAVGGIYATGGKTGFYGNHFFVILKEQADLSQASQIADVTERRRFVYTTLVEQADRTQAGIRQILDDRGVAYTSFYLVNSIEVSGDILLQEELARRPEVDRIIFSQNLRPLAEPLPFSESSDIEAPGDPTWNIELIGADRVWNELGVRGEGVVVGQSDSGVDWQHPALRESYRGKNGNHDYNWLDPWTGRAEPWDGNGHGTHTLGTVLGNTGTGVAPAATWLGCANLVRNIGNPPDYLHCMQFMLAPYPIGGDPLRDGDPTQAADVSTNSWGCPPIEGCDQESLLPGVQALRAAGIFFVAAAGNEGSACDSLRTPPGNYQALVSVGAIDRSSDLTSFSSRGPFTDSPDGRIAPTILAPGEDVPSAWPGGGYESSSGTSMATPHVAGVVALMWSANPALRGDVAATEQILIDTARPYEGLLIGCGPAGSALPNAESGYGIVDAYTAVQKALER
jgi:subtilisin family serine protease